MVPSARKVVACILLICGVAVYSQSQTGPTKAPGATITGKVTIKGNGLRGVVVTASLWNSDYEGAIFRGTTDHDGNYRIANVSPGIYRFDLFAPTFVQENQQTKPLVISEGETVENVNFALVPGGVITGKITNSDGHPVIAEFVFIVPVDLSNEYVHYYRGGIVTDDRGIYRAFSLRPGKYKVSAGLRGGFLRSKYRQTFHPSVIDEAKATVIEVREGNEVGNVDIIIMRSNDSGYKVTGRIVDGETGKPLAKVPYGLMQSSNDGRRSSVHTNAVTNADGQFTFENVLPGHYSVYILHDRSELRASPTQFEVVNGDVSDLIVKTIKVGSLSGVVIFEGKVSGRTPGGFRIHAWIDSDLDYFEDTAPVPINANGSFRLAGLTSGTVRLLITDTNPGGQHIGIVHIERDGIVLSRDFPLQEGEHMEGLRVVAKRFTGAIRGQLKFEGGEMPPAAQISVLVGRVEHESDFAGHAYGAHVDARGRFAIDGLNAGTYELQVSVMRNGRMDAGPKQRVVVADDTVTEVNVTVKLRQD